MKFSEVTRHKVKLCHSERGGLGEADLAFGGEEGLKVSRGWMSTDDSPPGSVLDFVLATTEPQDIFTLCNVRVHGHLLLPDFVVHGDVRGKSFLRIDIRFSGMSEW